MDESKITLSYIEAAADGHVRVSRGDLLDGTVPWEVVIVPAGGVVTGDGGEGVQRQVTVLQTATETTENEFRKGKCG